MVVYNLQAQAVWTRNDLINSIKWDGQIDLACQKGSKKVFLNQAFSSFKIISCPIFEKKPIPKFSDHFFKYNFKPFKN